MRMSSSVCTITPLGAGSIPKRRDTLFAETWSSQMIGFALRARSSIGGASHTARTSARCSAIAFGTSSPSTTLRYVRIRKASVNAIAAATTGSK